MTPSRFIALATCCAALVAAAPASAAPAPIVAGGSFARTVPFIDGSIYEFECHAAAPGATSTRITSCVLSDGVENLPATGPDLAKRGRRRDRFLLARLLPVEALLDRVCHLQRRQHADDKRLQRDIVAGERRLAQADRRAGRQRRLQHGPGPLLRGRSAG
jgi:hypothetical protein